MRIHRIRAYLNWPQERFDAVLKALQADHMIELHGGDPSQLTDGEIRGSFRNEHGQLFLTLSWRE